MCFVFFQVLEEVVVCLGSRWSESVLRIWWGGCSSPQVREETEATMFKMLEGICDRLTRAIEDEKRDRESTEETLLKLLEDTCARVESGLKY